MYGRTALFVAGIAVLCAASGCTTTTTVTTKPAPVSTHAAAATSAAKAAAKAPSIAHVGSTIVLKGENSGDQLTVTLVKVAPTVTATDGFSTPSTGNRYFAAQFRLTNSGTGAYDDAPSNGAKAIDGQGQQFDTTIVDSVNSGPQLPGDTKLAAGGTALGWLVFEVPTASKITSAQFSLSSGFGNTGEWKIP